MKFAVRWFALNIESNKGDHEYYFVYTIFKISSNLASTFNIETWEKEKNPEYPAKRQKRQSVS